MTRFLRVVELLETIKAYFDDHVVHVEVVLETAAFFFVKRTMAPQAR